MESLGELLARWQRFRSPSPWTMLRYEQAMRSLAHFGIRSLEDVRGPVVQQYVEFRLVFVKPQTINSDMAALLSVMKFAKAPAEAILAVRGCMLPMKKPRRLTARHLTRAEVAALAAAAKARAPSVEVPVLLCAYLGLRIRELCRVRWSDLDLGPRPQARVRIVTELGGEGRIKTGNERTVPMCAELKALLVERRASLGRDYLFRPGLDAAGVGSPYPFMRAHSMRTSLSRAVKHSGLEAVTWNTLRHTRASWWVQAGVPIAKVSAWLGHSPETCSRYYIGLRDGYDPECEQLPAA